MLPTTVDRVPNQTGKSVNQKIRRHTERRVEEVKRGGPAAIAKRLEELDAEWDVERTLEANAATASLIGVTLGAAVDRRWFALPAVVGAFLLQHAVQGWCPPLPVFRRLGFRTASEIDYERYALKALRGDFAELSEDRAQKSAKDRRSGTSGRGSIGIPMTCDENGFRVTRRSLIAGMATIPFSNSVVRAVLAAGEGQPPGLVIREKQPQNLESNFAALQGLITPNEQFYVRTHFAMPSVDAKSWDLKIDGAVSKALRIDYDELLSLPSITKTVTLECAGNGRVYLVPKADGVQWQLGAVGTADWTGVSLNSILERAGVDAKAVELVFEGADSGEPSKPSKPRKPITFARSVPLEVVRSGEVLLAYKMNGQPLPQSHGFPVRAIVPGWYGMASVKWLTRIAAVTQPFQGYFQTVDYAYWQHHDNFAVRVPVTEMQVKSQIARPAVAEVISKGSTYRVLGAAWSGNRAIAKVEVSADEGKSFAAATLLGEPVAHAWRLWEYSWNVPAKAGKYTLMAKATDVKGSVQPLERDKDREAYMINHVLPVEVQIQ